MRWRLLSVAAVAIGVVAYGLFAWTIRVPALIEEAELQSYEHRNGRDEALSDIAKGSPKWKVYGLQRDTDARGAVLRERLDVQLDWFAGCIVSDAIVQYAREYNAAVRDHLVGRFGQSAVSAILGDPPVEQHIVPSGANKSLEPTPTSVTPRAGARGAPAVGVAHL